MTRLATQSLAGSQSVPGVGTLSLSGSLNLKANVIATATGRIGYATNFDTMAGLFYLKGGAAFVNFDTSNFGGQATITPTGGGAPLSGAVDFSAPSANRWGWTIGVGTEWALAENWSIVGEWDFLDFGTQTLTFTDPNLGSSQVSAKQHINELKLGINYRALATGFLTDQFRPALYGSIDVTSKSARHTNPILFNRATRSADIILLFPRCIETHFPSRYFPSTWRKGTRQWPSRRLKFNRAIKPCSHL